MYRDQIIAIAKKHGAQAIIPGYGFLSENTDFARAVAAAGLVFAGPSPEAIESFGLKHTARDLAVSAGVPVVPGSAGLLTTEDDAAAEAQKLGFPVMLKATAGGGGMGLLICADEKELRSNFKVVQSRGESLFKNTGVFLERYYPDSRHIEVQVFGNGLGKAISIGERECSIQRRHQKVIEECPSPFITSTKPDLRQKLTTCAVKLAESINYGSAGTVEYLVDDHTGDFFFLEMNTRLQVEHGITEMCYGVDLVELMLQQADKQLQGKGGIEAKALETLQLRCIEPKGHAIEARVYAENPARNYAPSPGLLQEVSWHEPEGTRIDTWVRSGIIVSAEYDPLLAKVMFHGESRKDAIANMDKILLHSRICGPPVNLDFLRSIICDERFQSGQTTTKFLESFNFTPAAIDVISGGSYTLVQDFPGRPTIGRGFGHAGPMDDVAFRAANILVGNNPGTEALEITLVGPDLRFLGDAIVAVCGPSIPCHLDGSVLPSWTRVYVRAGQQLTFGKMEANCRAYLAVYKGFLNVAEWYGSKATNPMVNVGGYQGRPLRAGDFLRITDTDTLPSLHEDISVPENLRPQYTSDWTIQVMPGPYETGYLTTEDIETFYASTWKVSHNAARGGIRLIGPRPQFGRHDGGEGGAHPSNVIDYGYPIGGLNWTGDEPVILPVDCPNAGGFICNLTIIKGEFWKIGQLRAGDSVRFRRVGLQSALNCRQRNEDFLTDLSSAVESGVWGCAFDSTTLGDEVSFPGQDVVLLVEPTLTRPRLTCRVGGDNYLLVDYGDGKYNLNDQCRAAALKKRLEEAHGPASLNLTQGGEIYNSVSYGNAIALSYDGLKLPRSQLLARILAIDNSIGDMRSTKFPNHNYKLPVTFSHPNLVECVERYKANQRSIASFLPDPFQFVAENNGLTSQELKTLILDAKTIVSGVGFFMALPLLLPVDPRHRLVSPKMNPSRTYTPEGALAWGGSAMCIYPVDAPGGYMPLGMTIPCVDIFGFKAGFSTERPWKYETMDTVSFYEVGEEEYSRKLAEYRSGTYQFEVEESVFDMAEHNRLLATVSDEAASLQRNRSVAQGKMNEKEKALREEWLAQKNASGASEDKLQALLNGMIAPLRMS